MFIPKIQLQVENRNKTAHRMIWMSPSALMGLGPWMKLLGPWFGSNGLADPRSGLHHPPTHN